MLHVPAVEVCAADVNVPDTPPTVPGPLSVPLLDTVKPLTGSAEFAAAITGAVKFKTSSATTAILPNRAPPRHLVKSFFVSVSSMIPSTVSPSGHSNDFVPGTQTTQSAQCSLRDSAQRP